MTKRVKINFNTLNSDKIEVIPSEDIAKENARIKKEMKGFKRKSND